MTYAFIVSMFLMTLFSVVIVMMWRPFIHEFKKAWLKHTEVININEDHSIIKTTVPKNKGPAFEVKELGSVKTLNPKSIYFDTNAGTFVSFHLGSETIPFDFFKEDNTYAVPTKVDEKGNISYKTYRAGRGDAELIQSQLLRERQKNSMQKGLFSMEMVLILIVLIGLGIVIFFLVNQGITIDQIAQAGGLIRG